MKTLMENGWVELIQFLGRLADFFSTWVHENKSIQNQDQRYSRLKERIKQEIKALKKEALENVFDSLVKRLNCCIDVNGDIFEQ